MWTQTCNFTDGIRTEADPHYAARATLKKERRKQCYAEKEVGRVRATISIWTLHDREGTVKPAKYAVDAKGRLRLNKISREMPVIDTLLGIQDNDV